MSQREFDLTDKRVGRLVVQGIDGPYRGSQSRWRCLCDCGKYVTVPQRGLTWAERPTQSCGCLRKERFKYFPVKHGQARIGKATPAYRRWQGMLGRCYNPKNRKYPRYGGRGITVCERWHDSFESFYADMGDPPEGMTLERKDNEQGYDPSNCVWATHLTQSNNRGNNNPITWQGVTQTMRDWERQLGYPRILIQGRRRRGWGIERALTTPPDYTRHPKQRTAL